MKDQDLFEKIHAAVHADPVGSLFKGSGAGEGLIESDNPLFKFPSLDAIHEIERRVLSTRSDMRTYVAYLELHDDGPVPHGACASVEARTKALLDIIAGQIYDHEVSK